MAEAVALGFHAKMPLLFSQDGFGLISQAVREISRSLGAEVRQFSGMDVGLGFRGWPIDGSGVIMIKRADEVSERFLMELRELLEEGVYGEYRLPPGWTVMATLGDCSDRTVAKLSWNVRVRFCRLKVEYDSSDWESRKFVLPPGLVRDGVLNEDLHKMHPSVRAFREEYEKPNWKGYQINKEWIEDFRWEMASRLLIAADHLGDSIQQGRQIEHTALQTCLGSVLGEHVAMKLLQFHRGEIKHRHPLGIMSAGEPLPAEYVSLAESFRQVMDAAWPDREKSSE